MADQEIIGSAVKDGFIRELIYIFPGANIYDESSTNPFFPNFFVFQLTMDTEPDKYNRWLIHYFVNIRYRAASQPNTVVRLNEQLDGVALDMLAGLEYIEFMGEKFRIQNPRYEKVDGILQYFANITIPAKKPLPEIVKQLQLTTNIDTRTESEE